MDETARKLYEFYPADRKQDFYVAYLYLRHMENFLYQVYRLLGMKAAEPVHPAGPAVDDLLAGYARQIAECAPRRETNIYHGKVMKHADARKLVTLDAPVSFEAPERVVPFAIARSVVMENPGAIAVGRCPCRAVKPDPCLPPGEQDVCLIMGDPFASFAAANNPNYRACSRDEALRVLEKAHARGDVHTAYFKKEMGGRMMALCNCCRCCCTGMVMWNRLNGAIPFLAPSGYTAAVSEDCTGCGACADRCPFYAIAMDGETGRAVVNVAKCMGCGVCEGACAADAVALVRDGSKGEPLDVDALARG